VEIHRGGLQEKTFQRTDSPTVGQDQVAQVRYDAREVVSGDDAPRLASDLIVRFLDLTSAVSIPLLSFGWQIIRNQVALQPEAKFYGCSEV
jgi:hypothetical protein